MYSKNNNNNNNMESNNMENNNNIKNNNINSSDGQNKSQKRDKSFRFEQLEREIPKTAEFVKNGRIKVLTIPKNLKHPVHDDYYNEPSPLSEVKQHTGNFGVCVGFNHESGSSIAVIDIDGFKYKSMKANLKRMLPADKKAYFDSLNDEELDRICQESKDYLYEKLADLFEYPMVSKSANNGYHFFIFNKTQQDDREDKAHYISKNLVFGEDCPIEELRGLHLMESMEIFTRFTQKQVVLPSSTVKKSKNGIYKRIDDPKFANSWDTIGTVEDLEKTVKEGLENKGLEWELLEETTPEAPAKKETSYNNSSNYNNNSDLVELDQIKENDLLYLKNNVGKLIKLTKDKNYHNTLIVSVSNGLKSQGLGVDAITEIFDMALEEKDKKHKEEHMKQVRADLKSSKNKKTGFSTITRDFEETKPIIYKIRGKMTEIKENIEKKKNKERKERKQEKYNADLDDRVKLRKNPSKLINKNAALAFEEKIKEDGLINWLESRLHAIMLGDLKNVYRKTLAGFNVARGFDGYFFATEGDSGVGKSMEDETVLNELIPEIYVIKRNAPTYAAVTRNGDKHIEYYNRTLLYIGDIGRKEEIAEFMEIARVYRNLITEHEFIRETADNEKNGTMDLPLRAESCACVYSTTKQSGEVDNQLRSRTLNSTPKEVDEKEIMRFQAFLEVSTSPHSRAKAKAQQELQQFRNYFMYKTQDNREIVNPWGSIFERVSEAADVSVREYKQLRGLFNAYCVLTSYECEDIGNNQLLATEKQLSTFFKLIALESSMIPNIYNLLMLIKTGHKDQKKNKKGYTVPLLDVENATEKFSDLNFYVNKILEQTNKIYYKDEDQDCLEMDRAGAVDRSNQLGRDLSESFINRLMSTYGLKAKTGGVFFTISKIKNEFYSYRAVKDIDDMQTVLYELNQDGYLGKLEQKYKRNNVYYLTKKCEQLGEPFKITEEDREARKWYLTESGEV